MELVSVAAIADNRVIGTDGEIPWPSIPADRRQYRRRVAEHPVILGRRTFESMLEDLPGERQLVLSRSAPEYDVETATVVDGVDAAIERAERSCAELDRETAYVLGGGAVYALFQPHLDRMLLSRVPGTYEGDTRYPDWSESEWRLVRETEFEGFTLQEWERRTDRHE